MLHYIYHNVLHQHTVKQPEMFFICFNLLKKIQHPVVDSYWDIISLCDVYSIVKYSPYHTPGKHTHTPDAQAALRVCVKRT